MKQADAEYIAQLLLSLTGSRTETISVAGQAIMALTHDPRSISTAAGRRAIGEYSGALFLHHSDEADTNWTHLPQVVPSVDGLRASPVRSGSMMTLGYYAESDGGGGIFAWSAASTAADNGGTIICPTGHTTAGRWVRVWSDEINVRWFGARGNGVADDYAAIVAAQSALGFAGGTLFFPAGTYNVSQHLTAPSGYTWRGVSSYYQIADRTSRIVLTTEQDYMLVVGPTCQKFAAESLWFDAAHHAGKSVVYFPGTASAWFCTFTDCAFDKPKLVADGGLGHVVQMDGTSQIDDCTFERCQFWASTADGAINTGAALVFVGTNTNALLNTWRKCSFWGGQVGFEIRAGSAIVTGCDFGGITQHCVRAESVELLVENCYSEASGAWFFNQTNYAGPSSPFVKTILRGNVANGTGMGVALNCKCPTILENNTLAYYVFVTPAATVGVNRVIGRNNTITLDGAVQVFTGTGYPSMVDEWDDVLSTSGAIICPKGGPRQVIVSVTPYTAAPSSATEYVYNVSGVYAFNLPASPLNDQRVVVKDGTGNASAVNVITVSGNGRNIDGAGTATITTGYGCLRLVFNSAFNKWFIY